MFKFVTVALIALLSSSASAVTVEQRAQMKSQIDAAIDSYLEAQESTENTAEAEWGFLKNIVNIDRFFDSGVKA